MKERLRAFLDNLNPRERLLVYVAALALALFLPYQVIWVPLHHAVEDLQSRVQDQQRSLAWMKQAVPTVRSLQRNAGSGSGNRGRSLYGVIENTGRSRFGGNFRVQQEGQQGVVVWVEPGAFDEVLKWLDELQYRYKVSVKEFSVERGDGPGQVKARVVMGL
jgi:general secretion pathway protein M